MLATALMALAQAGQPIPPIDETRRQIEARDAALFWSVFEGCDAQALEGLLTEDFRMLHDLAGLAVPSRAAFVENMKQQCASREESGYRNRRLLVPGSRTITPLGDWGALERGWHTFSEWRGDEAGWVQTGGAQYWHVWRWDSGEGAFRLAESISVDHGAAPAYPPAGE